ncbi:MAG: hypothetical protein RR055_02410 [Oscillospiraceae bacterium]
MRLLRRMLDMCELSWEILTKSLIFSCLLLFCAFMLLADAGPMTAENYDTYLLAGELYALPQAILLVANIAGVIIEERHLR